jgi:hypothetical protein
MPNLDLSILEIMKGDVPVQKVMKGDSLVWNRIPYDSKVQYLEGLAKTNASYACFLFRYDVKDYTGFQVTMRYSKKEKSMNAGVVGCSGFSVSAQLNGSSLYKDGLYFRTLSYEQDNNAYANSNITYSINYLNDRKFRKNSTVVGSITDILSLASEQHYVGIFFLTNNGVFPTKGTGNYNTNYFTGAIYSFTITEYDQVVHDFIPVRIGSLGYMYDRITGQLLGNVGTGSFRLGPDVT